MKLKTSGDEIEMQEKRTAVRRQEKKGRKAEKEMKQAEKEKKKAAKNAAQKTSGFRLLGIRNKIVICFLVPIAFMIVIGVSAYQKAAE